LGLSGPLPARVPAEVKELVLKTVEEAVAGGFVHGWACSLWQVSDDRVHRWRVRRLHVGTLEDQAPGGHPVHGLLATEIEAILAIAETWGEVDRSHRKLAHRGSYTDTVWVSPSTFRRVLAENGLVVPAAPPRTPTTKTPWPDWLVWEPNRIWIWDVTHFTRAKRAAFAIVDVVSRYWIDTLVSIEETSTQVKVVFERALADQGLTDLLTPERLDLDVDDPDRPILLAVSDIHTRSCAGRCSSPGGGRRFDRTGVRSSLLIVRSRRLADLLPVDRGGGWGHAGDACPVENSVTGWQVAAGSLIANVWCRSLHLRGVPPASPAGLNRRSRFEDPSRDRCCLPCRPPGVVRRRDRRVRLVGSPVPH
jgi:hypothetical protein